MDKFDILKTKINELAVFLQKKGNEVSVEDIVNDLIDFINKEMEDQSSENNK